MIYFIISSMTEGKQTSNRTDYSGISLFSIYLLAIKNIRAL